MVKSTLAIIIYVCINVYLKIYISLTVGEWWSSTDDKENILDVVRFCFRKAMRWISRVSLEKINNLQCYNIVNIDYTLIIIMIYYNL